MGEHDKHRQRDSGTEGNCSTAEKRTPSSFRYMVALGLAVVAGIGGFLDTGGIITATQAGARFNYALAWTALFGFIGFAVFAEMSARVVVASAQPTYEALRKRLGPRLSGMAVIADFANHVMTLAVNFFGMSLALQFLTGLTYRAWVPILAFGLGLCLWRFSFTVVDNAAATLGLLMLVAVIAAIKLHPDWTNLATSLVHPSIPATKPTSAYLLAVTAMLGAFMTPYQFDFYSSGAMEEGWTAADLKVNRSVAVIGTFFGALLTFAIIVGASNALSGQGGGTATLRAAATATVAAFGAPGFYMFFLGVLAVSLAASIELCLSGSYAVCQYYGWDWGKTGPPCTAPTFNLIFIAEIVVAALIDMSGVDPIRFTVITMTLAAAALPFTFVPILLIANDPQFMGEQRNTLALNIVAIIVLAVLICTTIAAGPLIFITHGEF